MTYIVSGGALNSTNSTQLHEKFGVSYLSVKKGHDYYK